MNAYESPQYECIYIFLSYSAYATISVIFGLDGLAGGLCFHFGAQFQIIRQNVEDVLEDLQLLDIQGPFSKRENEKIMEKLIEIDQKYDKIIELCKKFIKLFTPNILIHFLSASFVICISLLDIIVASGLDKLIFVNYIMAATFQLWVYSIAGAFVSDTVKQQWSLYFGSIVLKINFLLTEPSSIQCRLQLSLVL